MIQIKAQSDCIINRLKYKDGDTVNEGDEILYIEIMKMIFPIQSTASGVITYKCMAYDYVTRDDVLAEVT